MITGKLYDWLKWIAQILLPLLGTLYFAFSGSLDLPKVDVVIGVIIALDLFLGIVLWISHFAYIMQIGQGDLLVEEDATGAMGMRLALDQTPEELASKKEVRFKVKKASPQQRPG